MSEPASPAPAVSGPAVPPAAAPPGAVPPPRADVPPPPPAAASPTPPAPTPAKPRRRERYALHVLSAYLVVAVGGLILLRATVDGVDFLGVGWILVLAIVPALPWIVPLLAKWAQRLSPFVQSLRLGAVQVDLRQAQQAPIGIATAGMQPSLPNDMAALAAGTGISSLVNSLRELQRLGGSPIGVVDVQEGRKWRLPNLYFLARLLELDPVVRQLVFTEMRSGIDGFLLGSAAPTDVRRRVEQAIPEYANAAAMMPRHDVSTLSDMNQAQGTANDFQQFLQLLGINSGREDDPLFGYLTAARLAAVVGPLVTAAVEDVAATLSAEQVTTVVTSPLPYVPATASGRVTGVLDRDAVALATARAAVQSL